MFWHPATLHRALQIFMRDLYQTIVTGCRTPAATSSVLGRTNYQAPLPEWDLHFFQEDLQTTDPLVVSKKLFIPEMNHSQPLNARRHSEPQKTISLPREVETILVSQPCLLLGTGKDIETPNHPFPSPYISGRLFLGSQGCVAACLTL